VNEDDLKRKQELDWDDRQCVFGITYSIGEVFHEIFDIKVSRLDLIVEPGKEANVSSCKQRMSELRCLPFRKGLLLRINPLLFDHQHDEDQHPSKVATTGSINAARVVVVVRRVRRPIGVRQRARRGNDRLVEFLYRPTEQLIDSVSLPDKLNLMLGN
jgi:hypothetical protein